MTVKRSSREGRWADLPPARVRFGIEAAFLLIVACGAALAKLGPAQVILSMFVAWALVALIERTHSHPAAQQVAFAAPSEPDSGKRRWSWRRKREEPEPEPEPVDPTAHARELEPEQPESETEPTEVVPEPPTPTVTKRALDLPGLEETQTAPPPSTEPEPPPEPAPTGSEPLPPPSPPPTAPVAEQPTPPPAPREWNLWELERQALEHAGAAARSEEWTALFVYLREFASTEGVLGKEFDGLVRESFAELIPAA
jgi:hypothetical protein